MKRAKKKSGRKPDVLRIEGMNWKEAIKKSFRKGRPPVSDQPDKNK